MPLVDGRFDQVELPEKHIRVLADHTRKWSTRVLYGGRGGGKDYAFIISAIERAVRVPTRVLCTREIMESIQASIYQTVVDCISMLGYNDYFEITKTEIRGKRNGSFFIFRGLKDLNADSIKSYQGIDLVIIGEAAYLSKESYLILEPTIRKEGSEIWVQFNPEFEDDFVYDHFVLNTPEDCIIEKVNYTDNPFCPQKLIDQAEKMKREDIELYKHIWLGEPRGKGGRVYPMYSPEIHRVPFDLDYLPKCDLYMSIDPHRKYYPAITWYAVTPSDAVVVYNEWPRREDLGGLWYDEARDQKAFDLSLKELAHIILANDYCLNGGRIIARCGDPRFLAENPDYTRELMAHGVMGWVDVPFERIETQRENLKSLMHYNPAIPVVGSNTPSWYVSDVCANKDRAYRRHSYDDKKDKESETHKDLIDNDRYFLSMFTDGKPRFTERRGTRPIGQIKSLASLQMEKMPASGYFASNKNNH